jgi:ribosomal protein S18 acetylase RimI-like enzyme
VLTIRKRITPEDVTALAKIEKICFPFGERWSSAVLADEVAAHDTWVAAVDGEIAGFLLADERSKYGYISTVDVLPDYRGRGIATRLMRVAEREYRKRGFREMRLEVHVDNPAQMLYFRLGYRAISVRKHYYKLNSHALSMVKSLLAR